MKKIVSTICAAAMTLTAVAATAVPVQAATMPRVSLETGTSDVQEIRHRRGYYTRGGYHYYNGHRGHRHHRPGWRRHNGWWFPPAAFITGAIIGGAIANRPAPVYRAPRYGNAHVQWCYNRYRSYRAYDNTYQPYNGPRQQCYSPYR
ncbi:BA14K family protein [Pseudaminobacter sp. NGMCC 1.201702]|uniref:BA14K family protein n=1 Tax=Pseudaminobacter sp. NGMCC 1.201702 TaxID=3391825 RepID=UPI0039EFFD05